MFEMHAIDKTNRVAYQAHLEAHFRIRHDIYVGERRWLDLARADGREIDAFDTVNAIYLLGIMPGRGVVAGSRLVPSIQPHLMSEVFPQLSSGPLPRAAEIFEWTRFFVAADLREQGRPCRAAGIVCCGILELCLRRAITKLTIVCEPFWYDRLVALGWNPRRLGKPLLHNGETIIGLVVDASAEALLATRRFYGISKPVLACGPA